VHFEPFALHLVASKNTQQLVPLEQGLYWLLPKIVRALALRIVQEVLYKSVIVAERVRP
jgi:hypothetical protein